jgi:uncharacterized membrane protein YphA (DoxX/SURF4 family)
LASIRGSAGYDSAVQRVDPALALAILRITTGGLVFLHGARKVLKGPVTAIGKAVAAQGFPEWFAYFITLGELAGLLLAVGLYIRVAGAVVALTMGSILVFTHLDSVTQLGTGKSTSFELLVMFGLSAALCAIVVPTRWSLGKRRR